MRSHFYSRDRGLRILVEIRIEALRNFSPGQIFLDVEGSGLTPHFFTPRAFLLPPLCNLGLTELANVRREVIMHSHPYSLSRALGVNRETLRIESAGDFLPSQTLFEAKGFGSLQSFGCSLLGHPLGRRDVGPRFNF